MSGPSVAPLLADPTPPEIVSMDSHFCEPRAVGEGGRALDEAGRAAAALLALAAGYLFNRWLSVSFGLPRDGVKAWVGADVASDLLALLQYGISLVWLTRAATPERFAWLSSSRVAIPAVAAFVLTGPVFSSFSQSGAYLRSDIAMDSRGLAIVVVGTFFAGCMVAWHAIFAMRHLPPSEARGYVSLQAGLLVTIVSLFCVGVTPPPPGVVSSLLEASPQLPASRRRRAHNREPRRCTTTCWDGSAPASASSTTARALRCSRLAPEFSRRARERTEWILSSRSRGGASRRTSTLRRWCSS